MNPVYWATADVLIVAARLGSSANLGTPDALRQQILAMLKQMVARCRAAGVGDADIAEARYAIVAFVDERVLKSNWSGRSEWMSAPLQLQLYRENAAGENFFARMRALTKTDKASAALEVYYMCLALGFTGALPAGLESIQSHAEAARERLPRVTPGAALSPHGIPQDHPRATARQRHLVLALALGCLLVVALGVTLLQWSLSDTLQRTAQELGAASPAPGAKPPR